MLRYAALMGAICLSAAAHAQTAQFSYAIQTPGGGFSSPAGVALDSSGNIYVADTANSAVKEIPSGCTASSCVITLGGGFNQPSGIAVDSSGTIYVADTQNSAIKKMNSNCTSSNCVVTLGGGFQSPHGVAVDGSGFVYVADTANNTIEQMASTCTSALYSAGSCSITSLGGNFFNGPEGVAVDSSGNVYVADTFNSAVEEMPPNCTSQTCIMALFALDTSSIINNGGGFNRPSGVAVDPSGNVYVADTQYTSLDKLTPNCHSSSCRTSVGSGFNMPQGVAVDGKGNLYVADTGNSAVKEFATTAVALPATAVGQTSQSATLTFTFTAGGHINHLNVVTQGAASLDFTDALTGTCDTNQIFHLYSVGDTCTVVVNFTPKYPGLRQGTVQLVSSSGSIIGSALVYGIGTGPLMVFNAPLTASALGGGYHNAQGIAVDGSGNVYVADVLNNAVKEVPSGCTSSSCVSTLGGGFTNPFGVAHDGGYNVYVADEGNNAVKEIPSGCTSSSCVLTLGGGFSSPNDVALDGSGNVYVADGGNNAVKEIPVGCSSSSCVLTLGGGFSSPYGVALDGSGNVYVADYGNNAVKEIPVGCTSSSCVLTLGGGFSVPRKVAVDAGGEVYVADSGHSLVKVVPAGCASSSCVSTLVSGFNSPEGVALDGAGNLYVSDTLNEALKKFDRFDAPSFTFATGTTIGTMDTTDGTQTATLANIGTQALSFPVPSSGFNPSFPSGFLYDSSSTCAQLATSSSAATLAVGASCTLGIDFQPTTAGTNSGSVVFTDTSLNAASATQSIAVSGTGLKQTPTVTVSPAVSYFGTTSVTLSAAVAFNGTTLPTGAFTFQVGSGTAFAATCTGTSSPLTCTASYSTGSLAAGSYTITGSIAADTNFLSASKTATLTVTTNANNPETESVLWNFVGSSGDQSESSLIQASDGNFYGTTSYSTGASSCGTVFQITPTGTYTVLYTFLGAATGACGPIGGLVQGTDGNFYGTAFGGGTYGYGAVYKISSTSPYTFTLMHSFNQSTDGALPTSALVQGNDGNFYGTTPSGGDNGDGTVFKISPTSPYTLTVLHSFAGGTLDGNSPGGLVQGTDGNFYGTTASGGAHNDGIVFKISPTSPYTFTLMHSFSGSDGENPGSALVQGTDGNLYGTTQGGGANNAGALFKISPASPYTETVLHSFSNVSTDGDQPNGLVEGSDGNFYGTTESAGANGVGLAYSISPSSPYTLSLLHSFANATTDGNDPQSGLAQGADGNFYGTTYSGGTNGIGVIYKLTPTSTLAAPVSLSAPASVSADAAFTLSYAVLNAPPTGAAVGTLQQCFATNTAGDTTGWTGVKTGYTTTTNASLTAPSTPGTYTYTLTCGGMESNAVTVTVPALATFGSMSFSPAATEPQGTSVAVTISDTVTYNSAQPTGAVTFVLNGTTYTATCTTTGSPETCSATVPAATIAALTRNSYTVTASLAADSNYTATTGTSGTFTISYPISYSAPTEPVGTASAAQTVTVPFTTTFTVGSVSVLTLGATGLDFNPATGGTCADGFSATPSTTCTVKYTFTPKFAGARYGAIVVKDTSGNTQATIYLNGTGTGPQTVFNAPLTAAALGGGFSGPIGVAADGSGNVYVADAFNNAVKEIPSGCTTSSCVLTLVGGFGSMNAIAVDGGGNVYVTDDDAVKQIPAGCTSLSCVTTLGGGFNQPQGIAVDGSDNIYVADTVNKAIKVMPSGCASSSCVTTLTTTALFPTYIAVDMSGNAYFDVGSYLTQQISEIPVGCASSSCVTAVGASFISPTGIVVDGSGNLYVADQGDNALKVMAAGCTSSSCVTTLATGLSIPAGVALDGGGNIYVADSLNNAVKRLDRVDAPTLTFATATPVGSTDTTDGQQTVTLANIGTSALTLSSVSAGDTNANFSGAATTCATSSPLAAGASCNLGVVFAPSSVGNPLTGSAVVTDNSLNNPSATQSVSVSGVSTALTATLGTLSFSPAATEPQGTSVAVTLSDTLTYSYARPTGAVTFVLNGTTYTATCTTTGSPETCSATVPAATIAALGVNTYTVTAALAADSVYAAATGTSGTFTIASSGSSGALIEPIGTASPVQTATISFTSTFTVGSVNVLTLGATGLDFNAASGGTCANGFSATPSTTCTVNYTFTPKYAGPRFGAITIADGSGVTQATVYLSGTGTGPQAVFTPGTTSLVGGTYGFYEPNAAAVDGSGNVYVADTYNFQVEKIPAGCTTSTCVITLGGFNQNAGNEPAGIAVDGSGQVYVADMNTNTVTVMAPTCTKSSCVTQLGGGFSGPNGVAVDGSGNVYIADTNNNAIEVMPPGCASVSCVTALGGNGFSYPEAVAVGPNGNLYVADTYNNAVDVMPANCMSTSCVTSLGGGYFYPTGVAADPSGNVYVADSFNNAIEVLASTCTSASCVMPLGSGYNNPEGVWLDGAGNAFISDSYNNQIKKLDRVDGPSLSFGSSNVYSSPGAQTATLTNIGTSALTFAVPSSGQNPTVPAEFSLGNTSNCPVLTSSSTAATLASGASCTLSVSFAPTTTGSVSGSVVLADNSLNNASATQAIPVSGTGTLRTATLGTVSFSPASSEPNGTPQSVTLSVTLSYTVVAPTGAVTFVLNGVNYTATCTSAGSPETCTATVPATTIATLAVNSYTVTAAMAADINYNPTTATSATFKITAVASIYTAPNEPVGTTSATQTAYVNITTAGTTSATLGTAVQVLTTGITGLDYAYVTGGSCAANTAYTAGQACTVEYTFTPRAPGARLGAVVISSGTTVLGTSYLAGTGTGPLAVIAPGAISTVAGNGSAGYVASQDTGTTAATAAELNSPAAVALDAAGNLYIADTNNNRIRKVTAATGDITTVAGNGTAGYDASQDTGTTLATAAELNSPYSVAIDGAGNLYIADLNNNRVRKVAAATGLISTVAGNGIQGAGSSLYSPQGVAVDAAGNLYIADWGNSRVRKVVLTTGSISTVAGNGTYGYVPSQDTGTTLATNAELSAPTAIAVDASGNLYIADSNNQRIRKVTASTGYISTVAGNGTAGYVASQDTGTTLATAAEIDEPEGVSVDAAGNLYIGDYMNHRIRKVTATGYISTVAGNGTTLYTASQDTGTTAANGTSLDFPRGATPDAAGNLYIADQSHERIRLVTASSATLTFGATAVGSSSAQQVVTLSNNGFSTALTVSSLTAGNVNANFSGAGTTCSTSSSLAAGAVCNLGVVLAPTVIATPFTASAVVTDNSLNNTGATQTVPINVDVATFGIMSLSPAATVAAGTSQAITISDTVTYNGAQPTGAVTFVLNGVSYPATCSPGLPENCTATVPAATIAALPGNTYTVTVALATDSNYYATTGTSGTFTVTAITPTISFTIPEKHAADAPFQVTATSNSAGAITYSLVSGPATVSTSGLVTLSGTAGTVQITASQAANGSYAAGSTTASFLAAVGSVWVVNGGGSVSLFDLAGNAFASSASTGGGLGAVSAPGTIAFDASGNAWIASTSGISEFNFDGTPVTLTANTSGGVSSPSGVAVDGAGSVWVSNANGTVSQLSNSGVAISPVAGYLGASTTATGGVAIDLSGNVWISNTTANTITELIGAATPTAPAATALANGTTGGRP